MQVNGIQLGDVHHQFHRRGAAESEDGPLSEIARRIGRDPAEVLEGASEPASKEPLRMATVEALERGVFGAPAFFVGDEMFCGNDRLYFVETALQKS